MYDGQRLFTLFTGLAGLFWLGKMALTKFSVKESIALFVILAMAGIVYLNTREKGILFCVMLILGMKQMELKKVMRLALWVYGLSFIPMAVLTSGHLIYSPSKIHMRPVLGYVIRWGLGYVHPNVAHVSYLVFSMLVVYVRKDKLSWKDCLLLMVGNVWVFIFTVSQTGLLMTTLFLAMICYYLLRKKLGRLEYGVVLIALPACIILSLVCPLVLKGRAFDLVNSLLNTRLYLSRLYLTEERITLFGKTMEITSSNITMDNSFVFAFMTYGIIPFSLLMLGAMWTIVRFVKEKKNIELIIILGVLGAGLTEPFLFNTSFKNPLLLFMGACLLRDRLHQGEAAYQFNRRINLVLPTCPFKGEWKRAVKKKEVRRMAAAALLVGVIFAGAYGLTKHVPTTYIAPRVNCQVFEQESIFLDEEEVKSLGQDVLVMDYQDADTEMVEFSGNIGRIEYMRGIITTFVYGSAVVFILVFFLYYMVQYRNLDRKKCR